MEEPVIVCENLTHYYGNRKIYENLSFEVAQGNIVGLLEKNGTGKTTTINILMGYLKPRGSSCRIFGEDVQHISPATRERIALLLEGHVQYSYMNIAQNADLLVLDDFSLGLDPGYRRLFCEYLRDYAKAEGKTVFLTSHIIQDLVIIMDYGSILVQESAKTLMAKYPGETLEDIFIDLTGKY